MARTAKPWYRKERDQWCVYVKGKIVVLAHGKANRKAAFTAFGELDDTKEPSEDHGRITGKTICDRYSEHVKETLKSNSARTRCWFLSLFGDYTERTAAKSVGKSHAESFLAKKKTWGATTKRDFLACLKTAWKWAMKKNMVAKNPFAGMEMPTAIAREHIPTPEEIELMMGKLLPAARPIVDFIRLTGCRPGEAAMLERRHVDLPNKQIRFAIGEDKTSKKTRKRRVIYITPAAEKIIRDALASNDGGPLFRNSIGNPWSRESLGRVVRTARDRAGVSAATVPYALRHNWATTALESGVPTADVAQLMGNSPEIVARVYSHLGERRAHLMGRALQVQGKIDGGKQEASPTP